jgi:hypothetical protein
MVAFGLSRGTEFQSRAEDQGILTDDLDQTLLEIQTCTFTTLNSDYRSSAGSWPCHRQAT